MFREWGFLISEMIVLIILAALLGLFVGWLIWGRRTGDVSNQADVADLQAKLNQCQLSHTQKDESIANLQAELSECHSARQGLKTAGAPVVTQADAQEASTDPGEDYDGDGILEGENEGVKPQSLDAARNGQPDDLKQIKGIGPKLEQLCFELGFFHFDQIASWTPDEVAWVNANLAGFKGRVSRDNWIDQARILAAGGETEFSKRVEDGNVY